MHVEIISVNFLVVSYPIRELGQVWFPRIYPGAVKSWELTTLKFCGFFFSRQNSLWQEVLVIRPFSRKFFFIYIYIVYIKLIEIMRKGIKISPLVLFRQVLVLAENLSVKKSLYLARWIYYKKKIMLPYFILYSTVIVCTFFYDSNLSYATIRMGFHTWVNVLVFVISSLEVKHFG